MRRLLSTLILTVALAACGGDEIPYYLFETSPADVGGGDTGGTDVGPTGCQTADDCGDGEACVEEVCLLSCASDDECTGATPLCETGAGICVECLAESNCDANQTCEEFACVGLCDNDDDCPDGECIEGTCEPVEAVCVPGSASCQENAVATCLDDGSGYELFLCDDGECVLADGSATCVSAECEPFERGCFDDQTAFECAEDGSERITSACAEGTICDAGDCVELLATCIDISPSRIDFGQVQIGEAGTRSFTIQPCDEPVEIVEIDFIVDAGSFAFAPSLTTPFVLDTPLDLTAEYYPTAVDDDYGEIAISTALGFDVLVLTGEGIDEGGEECTFPEVRCAVGDGEFSTFIEAPVGATVECSGTFTTTEVAEFGWALVDAPSASEVTVPMTSAASILFVPDVAGTYIVEMDIVDTEGVAGCAPVTAEVLATGGSGPDIPDISVALTWVNGADLDNHMKIVGRAGAWGLAPDDCFWSNTSSDWGGQLDQDVTDGFGPETISVVDLDFPITVRAGVWGQDLSPGSTVATMTLTVDGEVEERLSTTISSTDEFWEAWEIEIGEGGVSVTTIDVVTNGYP